MPKYTPEQIADAKTAIREADRHGRCHVLLHDAETILTTLEAAEKELDDERRMTDKAMEQYDKELEKNYTLETYIEKLEEIGDAIRHNGGVADFLAWDVTRKGKP